VRSIDHASAELRVIRDRLRRQKTRLRSTLESYLRGKETAKYLQDQVVSERNGRYVLLVKGRASRRHPGHRTRRLDQWRQPVSRAASAPSKSTMTSWLWKSRRQKRFGAFSLH